MKINYHLKMEEILKNIPNGEKPTLLLHSCCAPCSSYVLELLSSYFVITIFYYNPNIFPKEEFTKRFLEEKRLVQELSFKDKIKVIEGKYENNLFEDVIDSYRNLGEGSKRCFACYRLRMEKAAQFALKGGYDYFTTTLSISPYKNSDKINEIGRELQKKYGVSYLYADFKKKNGYKRSIELSSFYHLYRQNYCGCVYSKKEALERRKKNEKYQNI